MRYILFCLASLASLSLQAQDPEFPKNEFIMHLRMQSGMITRFNTSPDLFVGGIQIVPQYTVVKNFLRMGAIAGGFYGDKKIQGLLGPTLSFKLKTFALKNFGSGGNINLSVDHLWGTGHQKLFGGGLNIDLLNRFVLGTSLHRDYNNNNWWIQGSVAIRLSKVKSIPHP